MVNNETGHHSMSGRRTDAEIHNDTLKYLREMKVSRVKKNSRAYLF